MRLSPRSGSPSVQRSRSESRTQRMSSTASVSSQSFTHAVWDKTWSLVIADSFTVEAHVYLHSKFVPHSLDALVSVVYLNGRGVPNVLTFKVSLPLKIVLRPCPPIKDADYKVTLSTNKPAVSLLDLFPGKCRSACQSKSATTTRDSRFRIRAGQHHVQRGRISVLLRPLRHCAVVEDIAALPPAVGQSSVTLAVDIGTRAKTAQSPQSQKGCPVFVPAAVQLQQLAPDARVLHGDRGALCQAKQDEDDVGKTSAPFLILEVATCKFNIHILFTHMYCGRINFPNEQLSSGLLSAGCCPDSRIRRRRRSRTWTPCWKGRTGKSARPGSYAKANAAFPLGKSLQQLMRWSSASPS